MKAGWKTTEFWLTAVATAAALLHSVLPSDSTGATIATAVIAGLAAIGYSASRARVKSAELDASR
jgi:hypothetical protein